MTKLKLKIWLLCFDALGLFAKCKDALTSRTARIVFDAIAFVACMAGLFIAFVFLAVANGWVQ